MARTDQSQEDVEAIMQNTRSKLKELYQSRYSSHPTTASGDKCEIFDHSSKLHRPIQCYAVKFNTIKRENNVLTDINSTANIKEYLTQATNPNCLPLLIESSEGLGKSTLLNQLALEWAEDQCDILKMFDLVLLISETHVKWKGITDQRIQQKGVYTYMFDDLKVSCKEEKARILNSLKRKTILYLIDDHFTMDEDKDIYRHKTGYVIQTCRPDDYISHTFKTGQNSFVVCRLFGFSCDTMYSYVRTYFKDDVEGGQAKADQILNRCKEDVSLKHLMRWPLYAKLVCYLWDTTSLRVIPRTLTTLFNAIIKTRLVRYQNIFGGQVPNFEFQRNPLEESVPTDLRTVLLRVASLTHSTFDSKQTFFSKKFREKHELTLNDFQNLGLFSLTDDDWDDITFCNRMFHHYFAGLWLATIPLAPLGLTFIVRSQMLTGKPHFHFKKFAFLFAAGFSSKALERMVPPKHLQTKIPRVRIFSQELIFENGEERFMNMLARDELSCCDYQSPYLAAVSLRLLKNKSRSLKKIKTSNDFTLEKESESIHSASVYCEGQECLDDLERIDLPDVEELSFTGYRKFVNISTLCYRFPNLKAIFISKLPPGFNIEFLSHPNNNEFQLILGEPEKDSTNVGKKVRKCTQVHLKHSDVKEILKSKLLDECQITTLYYGYVSGSVVYSGMGSPPEPAVVTITEFMKRFPLLKAIILDPYSGYGNTTYTGSNNVISKRRGTCERSPQYPVTPIFEVLHELFESEPKAMECSRNTKPINLLVLNTKKGFQTGMDLVLRPKEDGFDALTVIFKYSSCMEPLDIVETFLENRQQSCTILWYIPFLYTNNGFMKNGKTSAQKLYTLITDLETSKQIILGPCNPCTELNMFYSRMLSRASKSWTLTWRIIRNPTTQVIGSEAFTPCNENDQTNSNAGGARASLPNTDGVWLPWKQFKDANQQHFNDNIENTIIFVRFTKLDSKITKRNRVTYYRRTQIDRSRWVYSCDRGVPTCSLLW